MTQEKIDSGEIKMLRSQYQRKNKSMLELLVIVVTAAVMIVMLLPSVHVHQASAHYFQSGRTENHDAQRHNVLARHIYWASQFDSPADTSDDESTESHSEEDAS